MSSIAAVTRPIVFLSDFGYRDEWVGICHAVIDKIAPESYVIDLSHGVPVLDGEVEGDRGDAGAGALERVASLLLGGVGTHDALADAAIRVGLHLTGPDVVPEAHPALPSTCSVAGRRTRDTRANDLDSTVCRWPAPMSQHTR